MKRYNHNSYNTTNSRRPDNNREGNFNRRDGFNRRPNNNFESNSRRDIRNRSPHADNHSYHNNHHRRNQDENGTPPALNINEIAGSLSSASNPNQITTILASAINAAFLAGTMNSSSNNRGNNNPTHASSSIDRRDRDLKRPARHSFSPPPPSHSRHHNNQRNLNNHHDDQTRTLFIGNLDRSITEAELRDIFEEFGVLEDVDIKTTNNDKHYAFVRYQNMDIAARARRALNNKTLGKQSIRIAYGKMIPTRCLWIGNLGPWLNYRQLLTFIERHAFPEKVVWSTGTSNAHALFRSISVATDVADAIKGYVFPGTDKPLKVDFIDDSRMLKTVQNRYLGQKPGHRGDNRYRDHSRDRSRPYQSPDRFNRRDSPKRRKPSCDKDTRSKIVKRPHTPFSNASDNSADSVSEISADNETGKTRPTKSADAKSYQNLTKILPEVWKGLFNLKACLYGCKMYLISGNISIINKYIKEPINNGSSPPTRETNTSSNGEPKTPPEEGEQIDEDEENNVSTLVKNGTNLKNIDLMITQRMKLEQPKLEELKGQLINENFCLLLATETSLDVKSKESNFKPLHNLVNYLKDKDAAGIVLLNNNGSKKSEEGSNVTTSGALLHVIPPSPFAVELIQKFCSPRFEKTSNCETDKYLLVAIVKENN